MKFGSTFVGALAGVLVGAAVVGAVAWGVNRDDDSGSTNTSTAPTTSQPVNSSSDNNNSSSSDATNFPALYDEVRPSIVRITTGQESNSPFDFGAEGLGSGIVVDTEGHILTNNHVVDGFDQVTVTFSDGTVGQADVVGTDPGDDIALIKVSVDDTSVLKPAKLGDSASVEVGETVAAIGNPFGLDGSFTTGVISGLDRTLQENQGQRPLHGLLQTDTAVNPGNSGGALINLDGEVIGINTAIYNNNGSGFTGIAYAVPINTPKRLLTQLVAGDTIEHARLGISGATLSPQEAEDLGVPYGVAVLTVERGSAADDAGLQPAENGTGDVIIEIDGQAMHKFEDLANYIDTKKAGDEVTLKVHRDGKDVELKATLKSWDSSA
jgi:S1-C subfamily serine protease